MSLNNSVLKAIRLAQAMDRSGRVHEAEIITACLARFADMNDISNLPGARTMIENPQDVPMFEGAITPSPFHSGHSNQGSSAPIKFPDIPDGTPQNQVAEIYARWLQSHMGQFSARDQFGAEQAAKSFEAMGRSSGNPQWLEMANRVRSQASRPEYGGMANTPNAIPQQGAPYPNFAPGSGAASYGPPVYTGPAPASSRRN